MGVMHRQRKNWERPGAEEVIELVASCSGSTVVAELARHGYKIMHDDDVSTLVERVRDWCAGTGDLDDIITP